ncbi:MAG: hypothetical protein WCS34_05965 [Bacteroidales bacterium]
MKMKNSLKSALLVVMAFCFVSSSAFAQDNDEKVINIAPADSVTHGSFITNGFFDNWFIGIAGGVNMYFGEYDSKADFTDRLSPALDISLGKWLTPEYGVRLQWAGLSAKGMTLPGAYFQDGSVNSEGYAKEKFNVSFLHADFMMNASNFFFGYKQDRIWNAIPYVGVGWASAEGEENEIAMSAGLYNTFKLTDRLDLTAEARALFVNQRFDTVVGDDEAEGMGTISVGLAYDISKVNSFNTYVPVKPDYSRYKKLIRMLKGENSDLKDENGKLAKDLANERAKQPEVKIVKEVKATPIVLFFGIDKYYLTKKELLNLDYFVKHALKLDPNKVFTVTGSADSATGSKKGNLTLSRKRMEAVCSILVKKYKISENNIVKKYIGGSDAHGKDLQLDRSVFVK